MKVDSYSRLERLLRVCDLRRIHVIVVAMPIGEPYPIDGLLRQVLSRHEAELVDMRATPGLSAADYPDGYHLSRKGAEIYSAALGRQLAAETGVCNGGWNPGPLAPILAPVATH